jgi:hypothetical protein
MRKIYYSIICIFLCSIAIAQDPTTTGETSGMRADGKIYVVMAVVITILTGLIIYLIRLDRKITRLEGKHVERK